MSLYTFACMKVAAAGKPGTAHAEMSNNLAGVLDFAKANRDRVKFWWPTSTDMTLSLSQKNCWLGNMHSTEMLRDAEGSRRNSARSCRRRTAPSRSSCG